jgi:hypothetical protein
MPTMPWTTAGQPEPDAPVVVLRTRLELRSYRYIPGLLRAAMRVRRQVLASEGAYGVSLLAQPLRKTFWTLSAWSDQVALDQFVRTPPHTGVMARYRGRLRQASFSTWERRAGDLPRANSNAKELWGEARTRLARSTTEGES